MLILSILLSLVTPNQFPGESVIVDFKFNSMRLGKPTLQYFYYDVTLQNTTKVPQYVLLPRWFETEIISTGTVTGTQYDSFGKSGGYTFFTDKTFTIITIPPNEKIILSNFEIETFTEYFSKKSTADIPVVICSQVKVGEYSLEDFIKKTELYDDGLKYQINNATSKKLTVNLK